MENKEEEFYDAFPNAPGLSKMLGLTKVENPTRFRGEGYNKEQWYSICSSHHPKNEPDPDCNRCKVGGYKRIYSNKFKYWIKEVFKK